MPYTKLGDIGTLDVNAGVTGGNLCCILTLNNTVQLMGNLELSGIDPSAYIAKLPQSMTPVADMVFPIYLESETELTLVPMKVDTQGQITVQTTSTEGTLYLNGVEFACADRYYNGEIGNNFAQGTSPLRWNMEKQ